MIVYLLQKNGVATIKAKSDIENNTQPSLDVLINNL
jgi:hypothetical protein